MMERQRGEVGAGQGGAMMVEERRGEGGGEKNSKACGETDENKGGGVKTRGGGREGGAQKNESGGKATCRTLTEQKEEGEGWRARKERRSQHELNKKRDTLKDTGKLTGGKGGRKRLPRSI